MSAWANSPSVHAYRHSGGELHDRYASVLFHRSARIPKAASADRLYRSAVPSADYRFWPWHGPICPYEPVLHIRYMLFGRVRTCSRPRHQFQSTKKKGAKQLRYAPGFRSRTGPMRHQLVTFAVHTPRTSKRTSAPEQLAAQSNNGVAFKRSRPGTECRRIPTVFCCILSSLQPKMHNC